MSENSNDIQEQQIGQPFELPLDKPAAKPSEDKAEQRSEQQEAKEDGPNPLPVGSVLGNKTIEDVIAREAKEEQDMSSPFSLSKTLGGVIIARTVQKQIWLVLLICVFLIIYINNRYICQKKMVEIAKTEQQLVKARYKATVCTSLLTEKSRESNIMELLSAFGDSTLAIPTDPPYLINVKDE